MAKKYTITHRVHGIDFVRTGDCHRCGACNCEKFHCPHFSKDLGNLAVCSIQDTKADVCEICTKDTESGFYRDGKPVTHQMCADFPDHPFLHVIRNGVCGYYFKRLNEVREESIEPLPFNYEPVK